MQDRIHQAYTHPLRAMVKRGHGLADLLALADEVRVMCDSRAWKLVAECVDAAVTRLQTQLENPSVLSHEKYAALAAEMRGLRAMQHAADTVLAFASEREREANERLAAQEQA